MKKLGFRIQKKKQKTLFVLFVQFVVSNFWVWGASFKNMIKMVCCGV